MLNSLHDAAGKEEMSREQKDGRWSGFSKKREKGIERGRWRGW